MGTEAGVGIGHNRHPVRAGQAAVGQALKEAGITQPHFVWLFASLGNDPEKLLPAVRAAKPRSSKARPNQALAPSSASGCQWVRPIASVVLRPHWLMAAAAFRACLIRHDVLHDFSTGLT